MSERVEEPREKLEIALTMLTDSVECGGRFEDLDTLLDAPDGDELFDGRPIVDAIVAMVRADERARVRGIVEGMRKPESIPCLCGPTDYCEHAAQESINANDNATLALVLATLSPEAG